MKEWMQRTELLLGSDRIERLRNARVLVVGLGGVGAYAAEAIARAGVGTMTIADADAVSESNINRQLPALHSTVGEPKAEVMARRLLDINPGLRLTVVRRYIRDEETETLLDEGFDYVVDAIDTLSPKAGLIRSCLERDIPVVSSMGAGAKTDPTRVRIEDIARSHHCPLAHMLRKRLHKMGIRTGFYVVFSDEPVREGSMMLCEETNKKSNVGTISYMPAVFGCHCASVVIRGLIGEMPPAAFAAETRDNVRHGQPTSPAGSGPASSNRPPAPEPAETPAGTMPMQSMTDLLSDRPYATMFQNPPNRAAYRFRDRKRPIRNDKKTGGIPASRVNIFGLPKQQSTFRSALFRSFPQAEAAPSASARSEPRRPVPRYARS